MTAAFEGGAASRGLAMVIAFSKRVGEYLYGAPAGIGARASRLQAEKCGQDGRAPTYGRASAITKCLSSLTNSASGSRPPVSRSILRNTSREDLYELLISIFSPAESSTCSAARGISSGRA